MAKIAVNLLGYLESDEYTFEALKEMLDTVQFDIHEIQKLGVAVAELPENYTIIEKKAVMAKIRKSGGLAEVIAKRREARETIFEDSTKENKQS